MSFWNLPPGWEWKPILSIAEDTERRNPSQTPESEFQYVDVGSVNNEKGQIELSDVSVLRGRDAPSRARKVIKKCDIVFATVRPYLRNIAIVPDTLDNQICSTGFCVLRAKTGLAEASYLYYACRSQFFINQLVPKQRGASYPAVTDGDVFNTLLPIPYPDDPVLSLNTQRHIIARIEALFTEVRELRELQDSIADNTNRLMQSVIAQTYQELSKEYDLTETSSVCTSITDGTHATPVYVEEGVPFLFVSHIVNRFLDFKDTKFVSQEYYNQLTDTRKPKIDDVLYSVVGSYGVPVVVDIDRDFCFQRHIAILKPYHDLIDSRFLCWMLDAPQVLEQAHKVVTGSAQKTLTLTYLRRLKFPYPPSASEQKRIAAHLDNVYSEIQAMHSLNKKDADRLQELEQAILAQAFRGEL